MVDQVPRPPNGNDSRPTPRSLEALMAAPAAPDPEAALAEAARERRDYGERLMAEELARRLTMPLDVLADELLREGGAS